MTLVPSLVSAFDCRSALVTFDEYTRKEVAIRKELSTLTEKKKLAESDYNRADDDLRDALAQVDKDIARKQVAFEKSILERLPKDLPKIRVHNKIDLRSEQPKIEIIDDETHIYLSAKHGQGVDLLRQHLLHLAGWQASGEGVFMARSRHLEALAKVAEHLQQAADILGQAELVAEELRLAQESLSEITGEFTPDDLLGEIFSKFCIGK
jgi:tRNA U34 5-carboxymethylaminomethyl modifying GTPase MnmE/TrmE